jgi:Uma2 family endonuclease
VDDESVVRGGDMIRRLSLAAYLSTDETNRPQELAYGLLREPPAPGFDHQIVVGRIHVALDRHVRRYGLGDVVESPVDVILDRERALVVQPDVVFLSKHRTKVSAGRIWGAPDLVVEVLSTFRRRHDRVTKVRWYREYKVRECWIVDPVARTVEVLELASSAARTFEGRQLVRSGVLPRLRMRADRAFALRTQKSELRSQKSEVRSQKSEVRTEPEHEPRTEHSEA